MYKFSAEKIDGMNTVQVAARDRLLSAMNSGEIRMEHLSQCPLCKSTVQSKVCSHDRHGISCGSFLCHSCSLVYTSPRARDEDLPWFYKNIYIPLNYGVETRAGNLFSKAQGENIFSYVREFLDSDSCIVDLGCGAGDVLTYFKDRLPDAEVYGIDFNCNLFPKDKALAVKFIEGGIDQLKLIPRKIDLLIMSHVLEHIVDLNSFFQKMKMYISKDTIVYFEVPGLKGYLSESRYYNMSFEEFHTFAHIYNFTRDSFKRLIQDQGFVSLKSSERVSCVARLISENDKVEIVETQILLNKSLPFLKDHFLDKVSPFYESKYSTYIFPVREQALSDLIVENKILHKKYGDLWDKINTLKRKPISSVFKYILKKLRG